MISFRHFSVVLFLALIFGWSCNQQKSNSVNHTAEKPKAAKVEKPKAEKPKPKPAPKKPVVTNKNVRSFLTHYGEKNPETMVRMTTDFGDMKIKLYSSTPLHRANFIRLVKSGFYDNTYFYRVVKGFVIQGGDSDADDRKKKKNAAGKYDIPAEFNDMFFHKRGAIAMTRNYKNNPEKHSAAFDFYIVQGEKFNNFQLDAMENEYEIEISEEKRAIYRTLGGAPHLDNEHTVFGEVVDGFAVIDSIAAVETDRSDWPVNDVYIQKIEVIK